jgi:hypothetical protein
MGSINVPSRISKELDALFAGSKFANRLGLIRRRRRRKVNRVLKGWTCASYEMDKNRMEKANSDVFLGATDVSDYIISNLIIARHDDKKGTQHEEITVLSTRSQWITFLKSMNHQRLIQLTNNDGFLIDDETNSYIRYDVNSSSVLVRLSGDLDVVDAWSKSISDAFEVVNNIIEWIYSADGQGIEIPIRGDRTPIDEMYPFLQDRTLVEYYDSFLSSSASVLLLIGPPGTGKTTFIRGLLQHANTSAMVTYDASILAKDYIFAQFIEGDRNILVIEDADNFLGARSDGNDMMHKFLNVGDGLVTTRNKKMIFSTNLPSIKDVDPALIRPGRCFDIVHFNTLTTEQATNLAKKLEIDFQVANTQDQYSLADMFYKQTEAPKTPKRKLGFV